MIPTTDQTRALHEAYCKCAKLEIGYTTYHHYVWERFIFNGHTQAELEMVCKWLWKLVNKGERTMRTFSFQSLIRDEPRFLDDLAQARAASRIAPDTDKAQVLKATGRAVQVKDTVKSADQIMRESEAFRKFREAGERL